MALNLSLTFALICMTFIVINVVKGDTTDCSAKQFSPCAVQTVFRLVSVAQASLSHAVGQSNPSAVFASINLGGQYQSGDFSLQIYDSNLVKVADSAAPDSIGQTIDQWLANGTILTSPNFGELLRSSGLTGGAWAYAYFYNWTAGASAAPVSRQFWVSSAWAGGQVYTIVSGFNNREFNQLGGYCNSYSFSECSSEIVYDLVEEGKKELMAANNPQVFFTTVNNSTKYNLNGGFTLTVLKADGSVVAGDYTFNSTFVFSAFSSAAAANGSWVVFNTTTQERQAWVVSVHAEDGNTYFLFSSHGTAAQSFCPACNCPTCPPLTPCPMCHEISECDIPEVARLKLDFQGLL